jgi:hypothetical protein
VICFDVEQHTHFLTLSLSLSLSLSLIFLVIEKVESNQEEAEVEEDEDTPPPPGPIIVQKEVIHVVQQKPEYLQSFICLSFHVLSFTFIGFFTLSYSIHLF